jgi:predicted membrane-bound dolichyl-phosphate-mannose-protein mannosyltransferase
VTYDVQWQLSHHLQGTQQLTAEGSAVECQTLLAAATIQVRLDHRTWFTSAYFGGVAMMDFSKFLTALVALLATQDPLGRAAALGFAAASNRGV